MVDNPAEQINEYMSRVINWLCTIGSAKCVYIQGVLSIEVNGRTVKVLVIIYKIVDVR